MNMNDVEGRTAIAKAAYGGHSEVLRLLVSAGSGINDIDESGNTVLHLVAGHTAVGAKGVEFASVALELGADINATNALGETPLMIAVNQSQIDMITFLEAQPGVVYPKTFLARLSRALVTIVIIIGWMQLAAFPFRVSGLNYPASYEILGQIFSFTLFELPFDIVFYAEKISVVTFLALAQFTLYFLTDEYEIRQDAISTMSAVGWYFMSKLLVIPFVRSVAEIFDCTCNVVGGMANTCYLDATIPYLDDGSIPSTFDFTDAQVCWGTGHIVLSVFAALFGLGFIVSAMRLVRVGGRVDKLWLEPLEFDPRDVLLAGLVCFVYPCIDFAGSRKRDRVAFDIDERGWFFAQRDSQRGWIAGAEMGKIALALISVLATSRANIQALANIASMAGLILIAFFVPIYTKPAANALNASAHGVIMYMNLVVGRATLTGDDLIDFFLFLIMGAIVAVASAIVQLGSAWAIDRWTGALDAPSYALGSPSSSSTLNTLSPTTPKTPHNTLVESPTPPTPHNTLTEAPAASASSDAAPVGKSMSAAGEESSSHPPAPEPPSEVVEGTGGSGEETSGSQAGEEGGGESAPEPPPEPSSSGGD